MKKLLIILLLIPIQLFAVRHYVKVGGGGAGTLASPFSTIAQVMAHTFVAGDTVSFNRGDTWRELFNMGNSGSLGSHIVFNAYGTGARPRIVGSVQTTWASMGGNIWKSETTVSNPFATGYQTDLFFEEAGDVVKWGVHKADTASLVAEYQWTWVANYLYVYAATDPDSRYVSVEVPQRYRCINMMSTQYITIDSLDLRYSTWINLEAYEVVDGAGFILKNCNIAYTGDQDLGNNYAMQVVRNNMYIQNNTIHDCGRRLISYHIYDFSGVSYHGLTIEGNTLYNCYHGGIGVAMDNGRANNTFSDIIIRNNLIYDDPNRTPKTDGFDITQQCAIRVEEPGGTIRDVQVYNNVFAYSTGTSLEINNIDTITVYNNTFYDFNHTGSYLGYILQLDISHGSTMVNIRNNIFYGDVVRTTVVPYCVLIEADQATANITFDYNLFYQSDATATLVSISATGRIYAINRPGYYTFANLKTDTGWETNAPTPANPNFVSTTDRHLQTGSPAIAAGIGVGLTTDKDGNAWAATPSIGAYEYNSEPPTPTDLATVESAYVSSKSITAIVTGNVTSTGGGIISSRGICWSTSVNPTTSNSKISTTGTTGSYSLGLTGLSGGTTYHVRAYAINESGTAYGSDVEFTTPAFTWGKTGGKIMYKNGKFYVNK